MKELEFPFDNNFIMKKKKSLRNELLKNDDLIEKNVAILSGSTIGDIKNILELFLLNEGIKPNFYEGNYGRYYEDIAFENIALKEFKPDYIYIHTSNKNIKYAPELDDTIEIIESKFEKTLNYFINIWNKIKCDYGCTIIQNNFELPTYRSLGNSDVSNAHGLTNFISRLNVEFSKYAQKNTNFYINDINYLSSYYGLEHWCDLSTWYCYKYCLNVECIPLLCKNISIIIKSLLGKNKKSIIVDLDNTLWGGIIGEVGVDGIYLGNETPLGMAYLDFQKYLKNLKKTGITLNICSKNEKHIALEGFNHSSSYLKDDDFICIEANWNNKDINIKKITNNLNILPDSIVFIDDNPAEREIVKRNLPQINVLDITSPESYIKCLDKSGFFEVTSYSCDDIKRNDFYMTNKLREDFKVNFDDYEDYLNSLDMECFLSSFKESELQRIVQLINKTNQFNLTTKRYSEKEVIEIIDNTDYITITAQLKDKFGDNGIVSLLIGKIENNTLNIDLWVMSCRVFKRNLEYAVFDQLVNMCKLRNIKIIRGYYYKTSKNKFVSNLYMELGFDLLNNVDDNTIWEYTIPNEYKNKNEVIGVIKNE